MSGPLLSKCIDNMDKARHRKHGPCGRGHAGSRGRYSDERYSGERYHACPVWQWGQVTVVDTGARKTQPHWQL
jgi:hypothetical protein